MSHSPISIFCIFHSLQRSQTCKCCIIFYFLYLKYNLCRRYHRFILHTLQSLNLNKSRQCKSNKYHHKQNCNCRLLIPKYSRSYNYCLGCKADNNCSFRQVLKNNLEGNLRIQQFNNKSIIQLPALNL